MRDWTPLTPPNASATTALATALSLVEHATGTPAEWNERQSWLSSPLSSDLRLVLQVPKLTWQVVDPRDRKKARSTAGGATLEQGFAWLTEAAATLNLPAPTAELPHAAAIAANLSEADTELLTAWLASAHQVLSLLAGTNPGWSSVRTQSTPLRTATTHSSSNITLAVDFSGPNHSEPAFTVTQPERDVTGLFPLVGGSWDPARHGAVLSATELEDTGQREQIVSFIADALGQLQS